MTKSSRRAPLPATLQHFPFNLIRHVLPDESLVPTEGQRRAWKEASQQTDIIADNLVRAFKASGPLGRQQFNQAVEQGIESVDNPLPELVAYFQELDNTPYWVDRRKIRIAQEALMRVPPELLFTGLLSFALPASYVSSKVNQTLARAGGLEIKAASRAVETTGWTLHCAQVGGLERFGAGFKGIAHVRLVHAFMRSGINRAGNWDYERWDVPINQAQYALTLMPFIAGTLAAIPLGNLMSPREIDAVLHMWRYIGHLMGVRPELQLASISDLLKMFWLTGETLIDPDELTYQLNKALRDATPLILGLPSDGLLAKPTNWLVRQGMDNLGRLVIGPHYSDALGIPKLTPMVGVVVGLIGARMAADIPMHFIPGANRRRVARNMRRHDQFMAAATQRVKADMSFNRDNARLNEKRIKTAPAVSDTSDQVVAKPALRA